MTSFEIVTPIGRVIRTFDDRKAAIRWADANRRDFPGCKVEEAYYPEPVRRVIWRERAMLKAVESAA